MKAQNLMRYSEADGRELFASTSLKAKQVFERRDSFFGEAEVPRTKFRNDFSNKLVK